jgi:hypothetical protein
MPEPSWRIRSWSSYEFRPALRVILNGRAKARTRGTLRYVRTCSVSEGSNKQLAQGVALQTARMLQSRFSGQVQDETGREFPITCLTTH